MLNLFIILYVFQLDDRLLLSVVANDGQYVVRNEVHAVITQAFHGDSVPEVPTRSPTTKMPATVRASTTQKVTTSRTENTTLPSQAKPASGSDDKEYG